MENGGLAQLARAPALHAGGHRFDSDILHQAMPGDNLFVFKYCDWVRWDLIARRGSRQRSLTYWNRIYSISAVYT